MKQRPVPQREREIIEAFNRRCVYALNSVLSTQKLLQKCAILTTIGFSTISHVIRTISSNNYSPLVSAAAENYNLRARKHNRILPQRITRLFDSNFIYRVLYSDILLTYCEAMFLYCCVAVCQHFTQ